MTSAHATTSQPTSAAPAIPPASCFCLPDGYTQLPAVETNDEFSDGVYWNKARLKDELMYQWHVYTWAQSLIRDGDIRSVLDIGCGAAGKLAQLIAPECDDVLGIDLPSAVRVASERHPSIAFDSIDIEQSGATLGRTFDLIICADVIEHLADSRVLLRFIRSACHPDTRVLLSTPDRPRLRGRSCMKSTMSGHVREWAADEFLAFLEQEEYVVHKSRLLPFAQGGLSEACFRDVLYRLRLAGRSPLRCHTVLCSPNHDR
jgi:SAM-dependent methyltransferase